MIVMPPDRALNVYESSDVCYEHKNAILAKASWLPPSIIFRSKMHPTAKVLATESILHRSKWQLVMKIDNRSFNYVHRSVRDTETAHEYRRLLLLLETPNQ